MACRLLNTVLEPKRLAKISKNAARFELKRLYVDNSDVDGKRCANGLLLFSWASLKSKPTLEQAEYRYWN